MKLRRVKQMARALREAHPGTRMAYWVGSRDYARRGLTNREGRNNRRWRQHWRESAPERAGTIVWPDYNY